MKRRAGRRKAKNQSEARFVKKLGFVKRFTLSGLVRANLLVATYSSFTKKWNIRTVFLDQKSKNPVRRLGFIKWLPLQDLNLRHTD